MSETTHMVVHGECLEALREMESESVNLCFTSPPYESARTYGIGFDLAGQDWVNWAVCRFEECYRVTNGLTAWVVEGRTNRFRWTATPALLIADLHRAGIRLRKPPVYRRNGIPGSGGPEWLRNDYETVVCASYGRLPWSDNTAMGHPPKCKPGGNPSHRTRDGERVSTKLQTRRKPNGERARDGRYKAPKLSNPGNVIHCGAVGGGNMGSQLAHENEAPFPEKLAEFFIRSFCPPGGVVLDPFAGSGTTAAVAKRLGRSSISIEVRESQVELIHRRLEEVTVAG